MFNRRTILFGIFMYLGTLTANANGFTDLKDQPLEAKKYIEKALLYDEFNPEFWYIYSPPRALLF